jgi:ribosomal protein S18 acetylase RimI-like enzyme
MTEFFQIREMQPGDLPAVITFWHTIEGMGMSPDDNPFDLAVYLCHNPALSYVAFEGINLIGAVLCSQDGRRGYINHLAVAKNHRKLGLGEKLVDQCLASLLRLGIRKCHIFVFQNNQAGIAFWSHTGWEHRTDLILMSRSISTPEV